MVKDGFVLKLLSDCPDTPQTGTHTRTHTHTHTHNGPSAPPATKVLVGKIVELCRWSYASAGIDGFLQVRSDSMNSTQTQ